MGDDFRLWDLIREQDVDNVAIKTRVANLMIGRLLLIKHAKFEISNLAVGPIESLCRATTDETREIIENFGNKDVGEIALNYVDAMRSTIIDEFKSRQSDHHEGCFLSSRATW